MRGVHRILQFRETALHQLRAFASRRHEYLDAGPGLASILSIRGEQHCVAQVAAGAEPQTVIEAFYRRALTDIHFVVLGRRDAGRIAVLSAQRRDRQGLVAVLVVDAKKPQRRRREQPVDRNLNVGAHMARKLPRGRDQLIPRNIREMPAQGFVGIIELLLADNVGQTARDFEHAVIANRGRRAFERKQVIAVKPAAQFAAAIEYFSVAGNPSAGDPERMTRGTDALSGSLEQAGGDLARIVSATCLSVFADCLGKSHRVDELLVEHRMQQFNDKLQRRFIVVMKDDLEVTGLGVNIMHDRYSLMNCYFGDRCGWPRRAKWTL